MNYKRILITGVTGFLGANITEKLCFEGYEVLAIKRENSDLWRCIEFKEQVKLINIEGNEFESDIVKFKPEVLVHTAWNGVSSKDRNNLSNQIENILLLVKLLKIVKKAGIKKIIALGSQAEYGYFNGRVNEKFSCNPITYYGSVKLATLQILRTFSELNNVRWYWLRLFSIYGPKEGTNWLIPFVIKKMLNDESIDLTLCQQKYDYIFIEDFTSAIVKTIETDVNNGVYNLSSNKSTELKIVIEELRNIMYSNSKLNFGALPYRNNQIMHIEGDSTNFFINFDYKLNIKFEEGLEKTFLYYKNYFVKKG